MKFPHLARKGRTKMGEIKEVIKAKLKALLSWLRGKSSDIQIANPSNIYNLYNL